MRPIRSMLAAAAVTVALSLAARAVPPAPTLSPKQDNAQLKAEVRNFDLLLDAPAVRSRTKPIPNSKYPTLDTDGWHRVVAEFMARVDKDAAKPTKESVAVLRKDFDVIVQNFHDQMYDSCPKECYDGDRRNMTNFLQLQMNGAVAEDRSKNDATLTKAQRESFEKYSARVSAIDPSKIWEVRSALDGTHPYTVVATEGGGVRKFYDRLRNPTRQPRPTAVNEPPPPYTGEWRPNQWVSKANWADYQKLVPWLQNVLEKTGTADLMRSVGIKPMDFTMALISSESSFYHGAHSGVGAYGFMQTLASTARNMIRNNNDEYQEIMKADIAANGADASNRILSPGGKKSRNEVTGQAMITNWKSNVFAGVTYLRQHVEEYRDRLAQMNITDPAQTGPLLQNIIAAAYNAGEGAVDKYWDRRIAVATADPTKSIVPYKETKAYVSKISNWSQMDWTGPVQPAPTPVSGRM